MIKYKPIPPSILTPERVESRLGPLTFFGAKPNAGTVEAVYDNLDFQRGVRAFLDGLPIASRNIHSAVIPGALTVLYW